MGKPAIVTVDDDPQVLSSLARDLRREFGKAYRIVKASSGSDALSVLRTLNERNEPVALLLTDQRMPVMDGTSFLQKAREFYPRAKKVLLTAYADTEAAIASINAVGLDHYLMKPWDPPEQGLYPVLHDLLGDWVTNVPAPYDGIRVVGALWSPPSHRVKDFLARNRIPYRWLDIEKDEEARTLVGSEDDGSERRLPVVLLPDGTVLEDPDHRDLASAVGLQTEASQPFYDVVIIGAGPAGLAAAVYAASEGLRTLMVDKEATGGQAGTSSRIENYLGFPNGVSGQDLATRATAQAKRLGAEVLTGIEAKGIDVQDTLRVVTLSDGHQVTCHAVVVATGVSLNKLDAPGIEDLTGAGVYYGAAVTEAASYRDHHVVVVGGANSAGQGAMFFSEYASKVTMLVRADSLKKGMSTYLIDQIEATPNIEVTLQTEIVEAIGKRGLECLRVVDRATGQEDVVDAAAVFLFIGAVPHSDLVAGLVERNPAGFIVTGADLMRGDQRPANWPVPRDPYPYETSVPGIFVAGDVRDGAVRRVASAVGQGANAISLVHEYLSTV